MGEIKAVIFDLDGVVFESSQLWGDIFFIFLNSLNLKPSKYLLKEIEEMEFEESFDYLAHFFKIPFQKLKNHFLKTTPLIFVSRVEIKKGVKEWILTLKQRGILCCVATSSLPIFYQPALQKWDLKFDVIWDTQMIQKGKEYADVYLACLQGISPCEALVIEDSKRGERSARMAGFQTFLVQTKEIDWREIDEKCFKYCRE